MGAQGRAGNRGSRMPRHSGTYSSDAGFLWMPVRISEDWSATNWHKIVFFPVQSP